MGSAWLIIGFLAQAMFTARFLVQWIVSERRRESTIPPAFWYLSLAGGVMLLCYAVWRRDPVFILGQGAGIVVYVRNIMLVHARRDSGAPHPRPGYLVPWLMLAVFAVVMAFAFQGTRGLTEPDEGRYAEVAREMVVTGDYVSPQLDFRPHFTKPPLTYWSIAGSLRLFGRSEWSVRLFLSLAYALTVLLVARIGADLWGPRAGILGGVVYATSLTPYVAASIVTPDTLLVLWETLAVWAFFRAGSARHPAGRWGWPALCGAAFGLAFLTKGPPGLLFLPAMLLARWLYRRRLPQSAPVLNVPGVLALLAVGLGWYVLVLQRNPEILRFWLREEVVGRLAGQHHRNSEWYGAFAIYLPTLTLGALPWAFLWPFLWRRARSRWGSRWWRPLLADRPVAGTLLLLVVVPLVVFSLSRSRLPLYLLPLFVPLALATGRAVVLLAGAPAAGNTPPVSGVPPVWRTGLATWSALLILARLAYAWHPGDADARSLYAALPRAADAQIVAADGREHYGLEFYAGRNLVRAGAEGEQTLDEVIARTSAADARPQIFLVRPEDRLDLEAKLQAAGVTVVEYPETRGRTILLAVGRLAAAPAAEPWGSPALPGQGTPNTAH